MSRDLFLAILSMDSYNRGYGEGVDGLKFQANITKLGNATLVTDSILKIGTEAEAASFYANAYDMTGVAGFGSGERVMSLRRPPPIVIPATAGIHEHLRRKTGKDSDPGFPPARE
jgi:hypothetical protein